MESMTREDAARTLRDLAVRVQDPDPQAAADRLLARIAETAPELRDALVEVGALAVVQEARPARRLTMISRRPTMIGRSPIMTNREALVGLDGSGDTQRHEDEAQAVALVPDAAEAAGGRRPWR